MWPYEGASLPFLRQCRGTDGKPTRTTCEPPRPSPNASVHASKMRVTAPTDISCIKKSFMRPAMQVDNASCVEIAHTCLPLPAQHASACLYCSAHLPLDVNNTLVQKAAEGPLTKASERTECNQSNACMESRYSTTRAYLEA